MIEVRKFHVEIYDDTQGQRINLQIEPDWLRSKIHEKKKQKELETTLNTLVRAFQHIMEIYAHD